MPKIHVTEQSSLKWPDGWDRTLIAARRPRASWKKTFNDAKQSLIKELERHGVAEALITYNVGSAERTDPGVSVFFSKNIGDDYTWQSALGLENVPAPTLAQVDEAFRRKAMPHHPDRGGDIKIFQMLVEYRERAKSWVLGTHKAEHEYAIPCDKFTESRLNLNAIRLALAAFRQLDRVGVPAILERTFLGFKTALPARASEASHVEQPVNA